MTTPLEGGTMLMQTASPGARTVRRPGLWAGRILCAVPVLFLLFDAFGKVTKAGPVVAGTARLGYPEHLVATIGLLELACVVIYLIPRTAVLGAILLTGYLGSAVATHVRIGDPLVSHVLFPVYVAALLWGGRLLLDERLRGVIPLRRGTP